MSLGGKLILALLILFTANIIAQKPELYLQTGHSGPIYSIAFNPKGDILASASEDQSVKLWDVETKREIRTLAGDGRIVSVAFSPDGKLLASSSDNGAIRVWEVETGKRVWSFGQSLNVPAVVFSPDGKYLAAWSKDLVIWEVSTWQEIRRIDGGGKFSFTLEISKGQVSTPLGFSPDSTKIAALSEGRLKLFDIKTGKKLRGYNQYTFRSMAFSSDGKIIAASESKLLSEGEGDKINLWDVTKEKLLGTLPGHSKAIVSMKFSPDGKMLATASYDKSIKLWDIVSRQEIRTLPGHNEWVNSIAFSPDGRTLASASGSLFFSSSENSIKFWEVATGKETYNFSGQGGKNFCLAVSPDGRKLATYTTDARRTILNIWDLAKGQKQQTFTIPSWILSIAFSPDGSQLVTSSRDGTATILDLNTGEPARIFKISNDTVFTSVFSPDGRTLASGGADKVIKIWDVTTGRELRQLAGHRENILSLAFSPDGKFLVSAGLDKAVLLWDFEAGRQIANLIDIATLKIAEIPGTTGLLDKLLGGQMFGGSNVTFSPNGKLLAVGIGGYGMAQVGNEQKVAKIQNEIRIYDVKSRLEINRLIGHQESIQSVSFSSDGQTLISGSADKTIIQWDLKTGRKINAFTKNLDSDTFAAFIVNRNIIAGVSRNILNLWNSNTGDLLVTLTSVENTNEWLAVTPDGLFDGSPVAWQKLLWRFSPNSGNEIMPVESFFNEFFYPNLLADIYAGQAPKAGAQIENKDRRQPLLKIILPELPAETSSSRKIKIKIEVAEAAPDAGYSTGSGARDVRLFRNGSLIKTWRGEVVSSGQGKVVLETEVSLMAGNNTLTAYAFNRDNVKSTDAVTKIKGAENLRQPGTTYILAIGVNTYSNPQFNLKYAVPDAQAFSRELRRRQVELNNSNRVEIISLFDKQATKANILAALKLFGGEAVSSPLSPELNKIESAQPEDVLMIYFAGHGFASNNQFYLIPHNLNYTGARGKISSAAMQAILAGSISDRDLETSFEKIDAGQMMLVIDACNSGQVLEAEEKRRGPMNSKGLAQLAYEKGMYILTASQSYQAALEAAQLGHGYLTYALVVEGMSEFRSDIAPKDGTILIREWFDYAVKRVPLMQQAQIVVVNPQPRVKQAVKKSNKNRQLEQVTDESAVLVKNNEGNFQLPRVFYRRETEDAPYIVARK